MVKDKDEDSEFATGFLGTLLKEILVSCVCIARFRTWSRNQKPMVALEAQHGEGLKYFLSAFWMLDIDICSEIWTKFCLKVSGLPALVGDVLCLVCSGCLGTFLEDKKLIFCLIGCLFYHENSTEFISNFKMCLLRDDCKSLSIMESDGATIAGFFDPQRLYPSWMAMRTDFSRLNLILKP